MGKGMRFIYTFFRFSNQPKKFISTRQNMLNRKLLEILKRLNLLEKSQLRQFLLSPYFNGGTKSGEILRLYDLIIQHEAVENHPDLRKEAVFALFFPGRPFEEKAKGPLDTLTTVLFQLVRRFLAQKGMEQENGEIFEYLMLAKFYRKYALEERFWQSIHQARKVQQQSVEHDALYFFKQYKIEEEELTFRGLYNTFEDDTNLYAVQENLDKYYSILKLEYASALEHQKRFTKLSEYPSQLMNDSVLKLSEAGGPFDLPINRIYRLIMSLAQNPDEDRNFQALEQITKEYRKEIPLDKYRDMMAYQRAFGVKRYLKSGQEGASQRSFEMYREHLEEGFFYIDQSITLNAFYNLILFALKQGELDWAKFFLDNHPPDRIYGTRYPEDIHSLGMAEYLFAAKHYEEAEKSLVYRLFENTFMSIAADVLLIKIYYETGNDLLETRMRALDQKVRRTRYSEEKKATYLNFLRKLDKIIKYAWQPRSSRRLKLREEIRTMPGISSREWLLEKLS